MRVGVVGDLHAPFVHPMYFDFVRDTFNKWKIDHVHFIGDIIDNHALGFWDHDPNGMSCEDEAAAAARFVQRWYKAYPRATVSIGNHDERPERVAKRYGMSSRFLRRYADVWQTPGWQWRFEHKIEGVLYIHGTGTSGKDAAFNNAIDRMMSVTQGHNHWAAGVKYHCNPDFRVFGLNVGNGIDIRAYAMAYGKHFARRPVLGCGIVVDGHEAHFIAMPCGRGEKYHRSRASKRRRAKR
jgi:predicted phosphodiesterase